MAMNSDNKKALQTTIENLRKVSVHTSNLTGMSAAQILLYAALYELKKDMSFEEAQKVIWREWSNLDKLYKEK
ncbi:MAG: hypothetical protein WDZ68_02070 [Candidatus Paceibacterota bacterium]